MSPHWKHNYQANRKSLSSAHTNCFSNSGPARKLLSKRNKGAVECQQGESMETSSHLQVQPRERKPVSQGQSRGADLVGGQRNAAGGGRVGHGLALAFTQQLPSLQVVQTRHSEEGGKPYGPSQRTSPGKHCSFNHSLIHLSFS